MKARWCVVSLALIVYAPALKAQQDTGQPLRSTPVLTQVLTDSVFGGASMTTSEIELAPGAVLTNPHSHPGDLFGYVLEGTVVTALNHAGIQRFEVGSMFYEPKGSVHTHFENASKTDPARVLIVLVSRPQP